MKNIEYWIWLSRIENLSPIILMKLLKKYKNPKKIWDAKKQELIKILKKEELVDSILNEKYRNNLDKYVLYMNQNNIDIITIFDEEYPDLLKNIYDPPILLYIKGNKNILNEMRYCNYWL